MPLTRPKPARSPAIDMVFMRALIPLLLAIVLPAAVGRAEAPAEADALGFTGVAPAAQGMAGLEAIDGPLAALKAIRAADVTASIPLQLRAPIGPRGGVAFWFRTDRAYHNGRQARPHRQPLLDAPGLFALDFIHDRRSTRLIWNWDRSLGKVSGLTIELPGLEGDQWHHLAFWWDASQGIFDGALDGTLLRVRGTRQQPWSAREVDRIALTPGRFAVAALAVGPDPLDEQALASALPPEQRGRADALLGQVDTPAVDLEALRGELVYRCGLAGPQDVAGWKLEGPAELTFADGWMRYDSSMAAGEGHSVFWAPPDLPGDFLAEWEFVPESREGLCIVFFCARGRGGQDLFDPSLQPREGLFPRYHNGDIDCYHISYYANNPGNAPGRVTSHLRKNHGFFLVANGPPAVLPGTPRPVRLSLIKQGRHIRFAADGKQVLAFEDGSERYGPALGAGKLGLRQMRPMIGLYRNLRVYRVKTIEP